MTDHPSDVDATAVDLLLQAQLASVRLFEAEVLALARLMPGPQTGAQHPVTDDEIEQGFENMPV